MKKLKFTRQMFDILYILILHFRKNKGKKNIISNSSIVSILNAKGYSITKPQIRQIIHLIRVTNFVPHLIATDKGYYMATSPQEILIYLNSLQGRIDSITEVKIALLHQLNNWGYK